MDQIEAYVKMRADWEDMSKSEKKSLNKIVTDNPLAFEETPSNLGIASDGSTASYYFLPKEATELYHLIIHKNMNGQVAEIFRSAYRYGESSHSDELRDIRKIIAYGKQEEERLLKIGGF